VLRSVSGRICYGVWEALLVNVFYFVGGRDILSGYNGVRAGHFRCEPGRGDDEFPVPRPYSASPLFFVSNSPVISNSNVTNTEWKVEKEDKLGEGMGVNGLDWMRYLGAE
jgi:hypothetical protein